MCPMVLGKVAVGLARNAFALKVPLTEERLVCTIVGGARTVHVWCYSVAEVCSLQPIIAVQVPGQYTLVLIEEL